MRALALAAAIAAGAAAPAGLIAGALTSAEAAGPPNADPDWPCVQRKVPSLTPAAIWTGPVVGEGELDWQADSEVAGLVGRLSQRRLPLEEAEAAIDSFAESLDPAEAKERLTLLFAGLFDTMNAERSDIIEGIERYARRMKDQAETIRNETADLAELRGSGAEPTAIEEAQTNLTWRTRIFEERRRSLTYVCEVPRLVEQRLFALGRTISRDLPD